MFSKADQSEKRPATSVVSSNVPSLLSADLKITGDVATDGELQLDGSIVGDISCGTLTVGNKAMITGEIRADKVMVYGKVEGRICASNVQLFQSAEVKGDILHETMSIEAGAYLEGMCKRITAADRSKPIAAVEPTATDATATSGENGAAKATFREQALTRKAAS